MPPPAVQDLSAATTDPTRRRHAAEPAGPAAGRCASTSSSPQHFETTGDAASATASAPPRASASGDGLLRTLAHAAACASSCSTRSTRRGGDGGNVDHKQFTLDPRRSSLEADAARELVMRVRPPLARARWTRSRVSPFAPPARTAVGDSRPASCTSATGRAARRQTRRACSQRRRRPADADRDRALPVPAPPRASIAFVNGHEHNNRIEPIAAASAPAATAASGRSTPPSHIDWPQQSRVLDLVDNRDGTLSIFGTILDHAAAPNPAARRPATAGPGDRLGQRLASISRELSLQRPATSRNGEDGQPTPAAARRTATSSSIGRAPLRARG